VPPLIEATQDSISTVRREACRGLGRLGDERAVEPLIVALGDADSAVMQAAIDALVAIGRPAAEPLCAALRRTTPKLHRRNIILALGGIGDPCAIIPLLNNLSSTYYVVRSATITALSAYGDQVADDLMSMVQTSSVPIDSLIREVREQPTKRLRLRAVRALGELKNARAIKPLRRLLNEYDTELSATTQDALSKIGQAAWARHGAVIALGNIASSRALAALIAALEDDSEYVRAEAARASAKIGDDSAVPTLIYVLEGDEHQFVRREAAGALRSLAVQTPDVAEAFRTALGDDSWEVRAEAARGLGRIDDPASVETLIAALTDDSYTVMTSAVHALANLRDLALPRLLAVAGGPDTPRREAAIEALNQAVSTELQVEVQALAECPEEERRDHATRLRGLLGL
jgi:HEAT repeat protein